MTKIYLLLGVFLLSACASSPKEQVEDIFKQYHPQYKECLQGQLAKVLFRVRLLPTGNTWEKKVIYKTKVLQESKVCVEKVLKEMDFSSIEMEQPQDIFYVLKIK
ncbi:MAG: hypothetical protein EP319_01965 [Deltaproteobacteria bacterium]|jgi:hypothetical protein|nr:MAG: hypothetical protein EP319_01965 [Deltaproteobacteria bacterium]